MSFKTLAKTLAAVAAILAGSSCARETVPPAFTAQVVAPERAPACTFTKSKIPIGKGYVLEDIATPSDSVYSGSSSSAGELAWAVGTGKNGLAPFVLTFAHNVWKYQALQTIGTSLTQVLGVAGIGPTDVWSVGEYSDGQGVTQPFVQHFDGKKWSFAKIASPGAHGGYLYRVSAFAKDDVWANGSTFGTTGYGGLIEHWDGKTWSIVNPAFKPALKGNVSLVNRPLQTSTGPTASLDLLYGLNKGTATWSGIAAGYPSSSTWKTYAIPNPNHYLQNSATSMTQISKGKYLIAGVGVKVVNGPPAGWVAEFDGKTVKQLPLPKVGPASSIESIAYSRTAAGALLAGWREDSAHKEYLLLEYFYGGKFLVEPLPKELGQLFGVAPVSGTDDWWIEGLEPPPIDQPFIMHAGCEYM